MFLCVVAWWVRDECVCVSGWTIYVEIPFIYLPGSGYIQLAPGIQVNAHARLIVGGLVRVGRKTLLYHLSEDHARCLST